MFDNMTGAVGFAMHEDRLAKAAQNRRLAQATQMKQPHDRSRSHVSRDGIAKGLLAVAERLGPRAAAPGTGTTIAAS